MDDLLSSLLSRRLSIDCLVMIVTRTLVYPNSPVKVWRLDETSTRCYASCWMQHQRIPLRCPMLNDRNFLTINSLYRVRLTRNERSVFAHLIGSSDTLYSPEISEAAAARSQGQSLRQQNTHGIPQYPTIHSAAAMQTPEHQSMMVTPSALNNDQPPSKFSMRNDIA
jgi:hypothetical protein